MASAIEKRPVWPYSLLASRRHFQTPGRLLPVAKGCDSAILHVPLGIPWRFHGAIAAPADFPEIRTARFKSGGMTPPTQQENWDVTKLQSRATFSIAVLHLPYELAFRAHRIRSGKSQNPDQCFISGTRTRPCKAAQGSLINGSNPTLSASSISTFQLHNPNAQGAVRGARPLLSRATNAPSIG